MLLGMGGEEKEDFFTLVVEGYDMDLGGLRQLAEGLVDVDHGGGLDQKVSATAEQKVKVGEQVGGAVLKGGDLPPFDVTARRIDENHVVVLVASLQQHYTVALPAGDIVLTECLEIVLGNRKEVGVELEIVDMRGLQSHEIAVDAHAAREVCQGAAPKRKEELGLIAGGGFGRALLAVEFGWVEIIVTTGKRRPFDRRLSLSFELLCHQAEVDCGIMLLLQQKPERVLVVVFVGEGDYFRIGIHFVRIILVDTLVVEFLKAVNDHGTVLLVGDTKPLGGGLQHFHGGIAAVDESVDSIGDVVLGLHFVAAFFEPFDKEFLTFGKVVGGEAKEVHGDGGFGGKGV